MVNLFEGMVEVLGFFVYSEFNVVVYCVDNSYNIFSSEIFFV